MLAHQILINALRRQTCLQRRSDLLGVRRAPARRTRLRSGGQVTGWFWVLFTRGAVGRDRGWFCAQPQIPRHGPAIQAEFARDASLRPAVAAESDDGLLNTHLESVHCLTAKTAFAAAAN
jgi:hypothetical protein